MSNIHSIEEKRNIKHESALSDVSRVEAASVWIAKLDGEFKAEDKTALEQWLSSDPENLDVFLEVAQLWDNMNALNRLADLFPQSFSSETHKLSSSWVRGIAASFLVVFSLVLYFNSSESNITVKQVQNNFDMQKSMSTTIGESRTVQLPDGSKLVLNTDTFADIQFTENTRIIDLKRGEIHIDVAHDKSRPLSVIAGGKVIQAVGTAFNVEMRPDSIELIVTDGKVLVAHVKNGLKLENIVMVNLSQPKSSMTISKGEKVNLVRMNKQSLKETIPKFVEEVIKVEPIEIAASLSWRHGNLIFRGESLAEAMAEISRYSDVKFELENNRQLQEIRVAGMFRTGDISGLLNVLQQNFNIEYEHISQEKILLRMAGNTPASSRN